MTGEHPPHVEYHPTLDPSIEADLVAECWFCDAVFTKEEWCSTCGFYKCAMCRRCACSLEGKKWEGADVKRMLEKTVRAMLGVRLHGSRRRWWR